MKTKTDTMKIYCFGNEFIKEDSLAKELADELKIENIEFIKCLGPEELPLDEEQLIILDVAKGIPRPVMLKGLDDLDKLKEHVCMSCHDIDLAFFLKLLKKTGTLKDVKIIAVPIDGEIDKIRQDVADMIKELL